MLSVCKSEPIPRTWGTSRRGTGQGTAPQTCQTSAASCLHAFVHPQSGANPAGTEKLLLVPARQAGSLGRVLVEGELGALFGWQSERGTHQSRALLPSQTLCHLYDLFQFS